MNIYTPIFEIFWKYKETYKRKLSFFKNIRTLHYWVTLRDEVRGAHGFEEQLLLKVYKSASKLAAFSPYSLHWLDWKKQQNTLIKRQNRTLNSYFGLMDLGLLSNLGFDNYLYFLSSLYNAVLYIMGTQRNIHGPFL